MEIQVGVNTSKEISFNNPLYRNEGWFVEVAPGTTFQGAIDIG
jgi:hypothetical protein